MGSTADSKAKEKLTHFQTLRKPGCCGTVFSYEDNV